MEQLAGSGVFITLDVKLLSALQKKLTGAFLREATQEIREHHKGGVRLKGRQLLKWIYSRFDTEESLHALFDYKDLDAVSYTHLTLPTILLV